MIHRKAPGACAPVVLIALVCATSLAQTKLKPGFNLFSPEQDVEIGKQSAREAEKELPILNERYVQRYVSNIGGRLAAEVSGEKFPYQFKVVNVSDINAFALPGGFMYVNRGLIEAARSEAELAGVMAHEISHVALRHGTNQASKAYLAQGALGMLGSVLGGNRSKTTDIVNAVGGFGLNATFLKFGRNAEKQADLLGVQTLHKAGYDPHAMASFFELLREERGRDTSKLEAFFSSHPPPENRAANIEKEIALLGPNRVKRGEGDFARLQRHLRGLPDAPAMKDLAQASGSGGGGTTGSPDRQPGGTRVPEQISLPSADFQSYRHSQGAYRLRYPQNWAARESQSSVGVTLVPPDGVVQGSTNVHILQGVIIDIVSLSRGAGFAPSLEEAGDQLTDQLARDNSYLDQKGDWQETFVDGEWALLRSLSGRSPITGRDETVKLAVRFAGESRLLYLLLITPTRDAPTLTTTFQRLLSSVHLGEG